MKTVKCISNRTRNGDVDRDLRVGRLYDVVTDPVRSIAGEYISVRLHNTLGPDLDRPTYLFAPAAPKKRPALRLLMSIDLYSGQTPLSMRVTNVNAPQTGFAIDNECSSYNAWMTLGCPKLIVGDHRVTPWIRYSGRAALRFMGFISNKKAR